MSDHHPDDFEIRPTPCLTGGQAAHIGVSNAALTLAEHCLMLVPTAGHRRRGTAGLTAAVVQLRRILNELQARAITTDLLDGATMADIAGALGMDEDLAYFQHGHLDWNHLANDPQAVWDGLRPTCVSQVHDSCAADPITAARHLDERYRKYIDPHEAAPVPQNAVTAGL
ncbi:hypothetical protein ACQP10_38135 (plasmid) [Streptosporangium sandarakinum]|uniref:hypothetical protein n=1 Tax=Streptosporangium sandarakinum TaxID=1260955 RepID=UPI003D8C37D8